LALQTDLVEAYEADDLDTLAHLSPDEFEAIRRKCREVGDSGEYFVYRYEQRRLRRAKKVDLANRVCLVSQKAVGAGYDVASFETDGSPRLIEVKSTIANSRTFSMSSNEWETAAKKRTLYWIYRVVRALDAPHISARIQDPIRAEEKGTIKRVPDSWCVTIV
jgi:hypothetical protein